MRRDYPGLEFFRGVEVQDRGALHDHMIVWSPTPLRIKDVRAIAIRAGFGHSVDLAPITSVKQVTYYVSKYVTKATDQREDVPWWGEVIDYDTGEVTEDLVDGRYRTWSCSREWGLSMAAVRAAARDRALEIQATRDAALYALLADQLGATPLPNKGIDESPPAPS
jgi:hypothetical protein